MGVRQRVILLTGGHRQSNDNNSSSSMGFYPSGSGIGDAAAAGSGFLFAVHYNSGPGTFFSSSGSYQGVLGASPCAYHGVTESDIFSFSGNVGLELCWLEDAWNTAIETGELAFHSAFTQYFFSPILTILLVLMSSQGNGSCPPPWNRGFPLLQALH